MSNWQDHISTLLTSAFVRTPTGIQGNTITESYKATDPNDLTCIKVGYLNEGELIYLQFENPKTPGFTEQQQREYFYRHDFDPEGSYGPPGLEFNDQNKEAVESLLLSGLNGKEVQYYLNGELIKSEIFFSYAGSEYAEFGTTIHFRKRNFWNRFFGETSKQTFTVEVQLSEIFGGVNAL